MCVYKAFQIQAGDETMHLMLHGAKAFMGHRHNQLYKHVATLSADNLEDVFSRMNIDGWRDHVDYLAPCTRSLSVGDIVFDGEKSFMVDRWGFTEVDFDVCSHVGHEFNGGMECQRCYRDMS